jgi:hypothetical protein
MIDSNVLQRPVRCFYSIGLQNTTSQAFFKIRRHSRKNSSEAKLVGAKPFKDGKDKKTSQNSPKKLTFDGAMRQYVQEINTSLATRKAVEANLSANQVSPTLKEQKDEPVFVKLPKERLKKRDVANESFEGEADSDSFHKKFRHQRLLLGMQLKPMEFGILNRSKEDTTIVSSRDWNMLDAGSNLCLCENKAEECMAEVEAYRQNYYTLTIEKAKDVEKELVNRAYELRMTNEKNDAHKFASQSRSKKRRTVSMVN